MFTKTLIKIYITCYKTTHVTGMWNRTYIPINTSHHMTILSIQTDIGTFSV
jgi:hypothetical protein